MARLPDLVRDSKLETRFLPDFSVETVHTYHEPTQRRVVSVSEHWKRQRKIGGGGYSTVWLENCPKASRHGVQVRAVKQIETGGRFARIDFNRELEAIAKFSHPKYERCFVKSFGWYSTLDNLFISMEYIELGDLHGYLLDRSALPEIQAQDISYQILEGLQIMHENEFIHRDLKPQNILVKSHPPQEWWIKIGDFGISKRMEENPETSTTLRGTAGFIAPELYGFINPGSPYSADIWSLGEITFQMLTKKPAFKPIGQLSSYTRHPETFPSTALSEAGVTAAGIDFVRSLMKPKPDSRLTTETALEHVWMQPPSEIPSTPEAKPLQTVEGYPNLEKNSKQHIGLHNKADESLSGTIRPREKTSSAGPKVTAAESAKSYHKVKTSGSETMRPRKSSGVMGPKVTTDEDYYAIDDPYEFSQLSSGPASDSIESPSEDEKVSPKSKETQSTPVSEVIPRRSEHPRVPEAVSANGPPIKKLSVAERIRALEKMKREKARASQNSKSTKSSSEGNASRIENRSVRPSQPTTRHAKSSSSHLRDEDTKEGDEAETFIPKDRSRDMGQSSKEEKLWPRRGKTRIPRKMLHAQAILEMGYPFLEDKNNFIIQKALSSEQIDELMTVSQRFRDA